MIRFKKQLEIKMFQKRRLKHREHKQIHIRYNALGEVGKKEKSYIIKP